MTQSVLCHELAYYDVFHIMDNTKQNLLIIGPVPEPKGGVSIHIRRLSALVQDSFNVRFIDESHIRKTGIFNLRSNNIPGYLRLLAWADVIHIHSGISALRFIHILAARLLFKKVIVTVHAFPFQKGWQPAVNSALLALTHHTILVSEEIAEILKPRKFSVRPAFIPPILDDEPPLSVPIKSWLDSQKQAHNAILAANAFRIDFHNGCDLYGIDLCIEMLDELVNARKKHIALIFVLASLSKSETPFAKYQDLIAQRGLTENMLLIHADMSFVKLVEYSDVILRPTCTDGDALTVREALYLGKPVVASDVVSRPEGTILFKNRNYQDMADTVMSVIDTPLPTPTSPQTMDEHRSFYTRIYGGKLS